jgi:hypothetical protein
MHASCVDAIRIPFVLENERIVVEADVNGTAGRFIWDSGASASVVNCRFDNLRYVDNRPFFWIGGGEKADVYIINEMTVGGVRIKSQSEITSVPADIQKQLLEPYGYDGLLGIETFNGYWCEISFSQNAITLHKEKPTYFTQSVPAAKAEKFFTIPVAVDGISYRFVVDTGMPVSLTLPPDVIQLKAEGDYIRVRSSKANGDRYIRVRLRNDDYYAVKAHSVTVFNDAFKEKYFFTDVPNGISMFHNRRLGIIGLPALRNYDLLFDLTGTGASREMRVYYKPRNEFEDRIIGLRHLNRQVGLVRYNNVPEGIALDLLEGSPLLALGVNENTVITMVNGKAMKDTHGHLSWDRPIHFTILEDGEEKTVIY